MRQSAWRLTWRYALVALALLFFLFPLYWLVMISF